MGELAQNLYFPSLVAEALSEGAGEVLVFRFLSLICFQDAFPVACLFTVYLAQAPFCTCSRTRAQIIRAEIFCAKNVASSSGLKSPVPGVGF